MKKLFIISALIIASLCSCIKGSKLVILAAEEAEYNKCREIFPEIECIRVCFCEAETSPRLRMKPSLHCAYNKVCHYYGICRHSGEEIQLKINKKYDRKD